MRKTSLVLAALLAMAGVCVMLWPTFTGSRLESYAEEAAQTFLEERKPEQKHSELLADLQAYNQRIYAEKQSSLVDLEACEESAADLIAYGIEDEIIGVLEIPAMELTMPVYEGITPYQAENIFRTNIQTAYNVGHYKQMTEPGVKALRPYPRCGEIVCGVWPHIVSEGHLVASTVMAQGGASGGGNPFPRAGTFAASEEFYHFGAYTIYQGFASDIEAGSKAAQGAKVYLRCSTSTRCSTNAKGGAAE